jgi:hypothetical protein
MHHSKGGSMTRTEAGGRRRGAALAVGIVAAVAAAGCAGGGRHVERRYASTYTFTVPLDPGGCPQQPTVDVRNCDPPGSPPADCVHARNRDQVVFRWAPPPPGAPAFRIQFSPFKHGEIPSSDGKPTADKQWLQVGKQIDAPANPRKPYPFSIVSDDPKCRPVDPQIIVDW